VEYYRRRLGYAAIGGIIMYVQYCHCLRLDNFENVKKIVVPNGPYEESILYCCEECYKTYFAKVDATMAMTAYPQTA
jgi:hypothetical protein